jgi:hypothetical protein
MMGSRSRAVFASASLLIGCSLVTSLDDLGPSDGAPSGDASMDAADSEVGDAGAGDADANLVSNASFDQGQGGCGPGWGNGYGMTFTRISPGRTGPYACEVCIQGTTDSYEVDSLIPIPCSPARITPRRG